MVTPNAEKGRRYLTVADLRNELRSLSAEMWVVVHAGWDFPIEDCKVDHEDEVLVLFPDYEDQAEMVSRSWFETWRHLPPVGSSGTP